MGFPRQEYWSGLPFPRLGDLLKQWIEPASPALAGRFFSPELPGKPREVFTRGLSPKGWVGVFPGRRNHEKKGMGVNDMCEKQQK